MHTVIKAKNEVREWLMKNNLILHVISTSLSGSTKMKIMVLIHKRNDHLWFLTYDWHHEWKKGYSTGVIDSNEYGDTSHDLRPLPFVGVGVADWQVTI